MESKKYNFPISFWGDETTLDGVGENTSGNFYRLPVKTKDLFAICKIKKELFNDLLKYSENLYVCIYKINDNLIMDIAFHFINLPSEFINYENMCNPSFTDEFKINSIFTENEFNTLISLIKNNIPLFKKTISSRINHLLSNEYDNSLRSVSSCE